MIRCTVLLSTLAMSMMLGACNSKKQSAPDDAASAPAAVLPADAAVVDAQAAAVAAPPKRDIWQAIAPFVAGSYSGACSPTPDAPAAAATITVGADGKVSSGRLSADLRGANNGALSRMHGADGKYTAIASVGINEYSSEGVSFFLQAGHASADTQASFQHGAGTLACAGVSGAPSLAAAPLYPALLKLVQEKKQTVECADPKNLAAHNKLDVELQDGRIKIGEVTIDLAGAANETFGISNREDKLNYLVNFPDKRQVALAWNLAGKLIAVSDQQFETARTMCVTFERP